MRFGQAHENVVEPITDSVFAHRLTTEKVIAEQRHAARPTPWVDEPLSSVWPPLAHSPASHAHLEG